MALVAACDKPPLDEHVYTGGPRGTDPPALPMDGGVRWPAWDGGLGDGGLGSLPECGPGPDADVPFSKAALLESIGRCAQVRHCELAHVTEDFASRARAYAGDPTSAHLQSTRAAWARAMATWQVAELFRFGPAARAADDPAGQGLRDQIYPWPLDSRCKVEEQLVSQAYEDSDFASTLISGRGLSAAEYLLFYTADDNACTRFSTINADGTWDALSPEVLRSRKAAYAAAVAEDVHAHAQALQEAWAEAGGDFFTELTEPSADSEAYMSTQQALNAVSHALFYVDKELKDWKLARPAGLLDCAAMTCPETVESRYAQVSTDHLARNLAGFRLLFEGCAGGGRGLGFDDWLREVGASDLADRMLEALAGAQAAVAQLDPPLEQALVEDPSKVVAVHAAVKRLTDLIKTEFVSVLNLEPPMSAEGDND